MLVDTTYILPLARVQVDTDLLFAIAENKTKVKMDELAISLISIFELQAKCIKLGIPAKFVNESIQAIVNNFEIKTFSDPDIVEFSTEIMKETLMGDYIDCLIVATAAACEEKLLTEDSKIWKYAKAIRRNYGVELIRYRDVLTSVSKESV